MSAFDWLKERAERSRKEWESHIKPEIRALIDRGNVTCLEWENLRMNSWERESIVPAMSNELLARTIRYALKNCNRRRVPASTYDEALQLYAEEAARRLEAANAQIRDLLQFLQGTDPAAGFMCAMFGKVQTGKHPFRGENGFPGANGNICCVPDGLGGDSTHLCGKGKADPIHSL